MDNVIKETDDFEEYEHDDELERYSKLLNFYQSFHNKYYKNNNNMFSDINKNTDTNDSLEHLYSIIEKYKRNKQKDERIVEIYEINNIDEINIDDFEELYSFSIDDQIEIASGDQLTIFYYIVDNFNWNKIKWTIKKIK